MIINVAMGNFKSWIAILVSWKINNKKNEVIAKTVNPNAVNTNKYRKKVIALCNNFDWCI